MATLKQRKLAKEVLESKGDISISKAMLKAGYPPTTAKNPQQVTKSKGFKELLDQMGVTDEKLAKVLNEGLEANKTVVMGKESNEAFVDIQPDHPTRHKFLETGLRLRGYAKDEVPNFNINFINQIPRPNGRINPQPQAESEAEPISQQ